MRRVRHPRLTGALLLLLSVALAYWPALDAGFVWDDDDYVTQNPVLRTPAGIWRIWFQPLSLPQYYPLVHSTFWLEYRLWGPSPLGYHAVNLLLHAGAATLLWRLLVRLAVPGALFAALLFAVHPVGVESVAWVTERKNVLSLVCYLLAAHAWLRWRDEHRPRSFWIATAWFVAALLGKTVTASLPAALLLVTWWQRGRIERREWLAAAPWFLLGAALGWFTVHLEATHVGAATALQLSPAERLLVAGRAAWFYLASLLWPWQLCFNYPRWQLDTGSLAQWVFVAAAAAAPALLWLLRARLGRGPLTALLLFGGTLVPALGFFDVYPFRFSFVADHFQYHANLAIFAGIAALAARATARWPAQARLGLAALVALPLAVASFRLCRDYRDEPTLWSATLRCNPDSALALGNLGGLALARGDLAAAKDYSERAVRTDAGCHEAIANLAVIAHRGGDRTTARRLYEQALAMKPNSAASHHNLGVLLRETGQKAEGLRLLRRAVELDPDYYDGRVTLAAALCDERQWAECIEAALWVLQRTPEATATRLQAVEALLALGRYDLAIRNAALLARQQPELPQATAALARGIAGVLRPLPPAEVPARAAAVVGGTGIASARLMPAIVDGLRRLGAAPQAEALQKATTGR